MQSAVKFSVFARDNDTVTTTEPAEGGETANTYDLIGTTAVILPLSTTDTNMTLSVSSLYYELSFQYRSQCAADYYGPQCSVLCVGMNSDSQGHYSCDSEGNRVCLPGYTGLEDNCTTIIIQGEYITLDKIILYCILHYSINFTI